MKSFPEYVIEQHDQFTPSENIGLDVQYAHMKVVFRVDSITVRCSTVSQNLLVQLCKVKMSANYWYKREGRVTVPQSIYLELILLIISSIAVCEWMGFYQMKTSRLR